eukprot:s3321_g1.t1
MALAHFCLIEAGEHVAICGILCKKLIRQVQAVAKTPGLPDPRALHRILRRILGEGRLQKLPLGIWAPKVSNTRCCLKTRLPSRSVSRWGQHGPWRRGQAASNVSESWDASRASEM